MTFERELQALGATYRLDRISGKGGSASVFKAFRVDRDGHSRQVVALKILKDKNAIPWLRKEFETLTRIRSVHCAQVYAWETLPDGPALVMEWIDGVTLYDFARGSQFHPSVLTEIIAQTRAGLRELSSSGLHHGDLSPRNILIDRSGLVRLVDFATASSKSGQIIGTLPYLSPDLWTGAPTSIEADFFALDLITRDARAAFSNVPSSPEECRQRAFNVGSSNLQNGEVSSTFETRSLLAHAVSRHLDVASSLCQKTRTLDGSPSRRKSWSFVRRAISFAGLIVGVIGMSAVVPVRAQAPIPAVEFARAVDRSQPASLKIASNRWIFVRLNGKDVGYAPVQLKSLMPGRHRLEWKTSTNRGETHLNLAPGQRLLLSESDLSRLE
jgi:serine/threonine protein kinase